MSDVTPLVGTTSPLARTDPSLLDRWAEVYDRVGDLRAVAVLRIVLGPVVLLHLWPFLQDARQGVSYDDHFWHPYASWMPRPSDGMWEAMLWAGVGAAVLMSLGLVTRLATATAFAVVAGNLLVSTTHFGHNRTFLAILLGGMALLPVGHQLSVDAWWRRHRGLRPPEPDASTATSPLWPLMLLRVQVSLVYLASGISKLVDPDWFGGLVLWDRVVRNQHHLEPTPLPDWSIDLLTWRPLFYVVAPVVVLSEVLVGLGLWWRRGRMAALWVAFVFHLSIEISASVEVFSLAAIAALAIWVTPTTRDRTIVVPQGARALPVAVRTLDWFARFRIVAADPDQPALAVVDRDGTVLTGRAAGCLVLSRLPVTFPLLPLLALIRHRGGRRAHPPIGAPGADGVSDPA